MRSLFAGQFIELSNVSAGSVVMWPDKNGRPCYALKVAPGQSVDRVCLFQEDLLILSPSTEFSVGQLLSRDQRSRVFTLQDTAIAPVLSGVEISFAGISKPGDLELWPDRICMRARARDEDRENPLVDLGSGEILVHDGEESQRDEVRFPAIIRQWELMRQVAPRSDKEILYRKG